MACPMVCSRWTRRSRWCDPIVIVVDASVVATALLDNGPDGHRVRNRLAAEQLAAPDLMRLEVVSALRRVALAAKPSSPTPIAVAEDHLVDLAVVVYATAPLIGRVWSLRDNLTPYDACYVALAEALSCVLVTGDRHLAGAPGVRCSVEVL